MHLGVDIGGTTIKAGIFQPDNHVPFETASCPSVMTGGRDLVEAVAETVAKLGVDQDQTCTIGAVLPGIVDPAAGTVRDAVNLGINHRPFPFAAKLEQRLGCPRLPIENDVRGATIGAAATLRRTEEADSVLYLGIGTGLAAGFIVGDTLFRGSSGLAGEIGHISYGSGGARCRCGRTGCLETIVAGPAITRGWPGPDPARHLFDAAWRDEPEASSVADPIIENLARLIVWLTVTYDPTLIALGGGVGTSTPALVHLLTAKISGWELNLPGQPPHGPAERLRSLGSAVPAGVLGAALLAQRSPHTH